MATTLNHWNWRMKISLTEELPNGILLTKCLIRYWENDVILNINN